MNLRCPNCRTLYRVDPERIPAHNGRARCVRCNEVFPIEEHTEVRRSEAIDAGPQAEPQRVDHQAIEPLAPKQQSVATQEIEAAGGIDTAVQAAPPPGALATSTSVEPSPPAPEPTEALGAHFFGPQDPNQRARHLARALVSDIAAYYPDRLERSRAEGTLRDEFREEILKSWEEYVLQVGSEFARETDHFQNALNEILAKGQQVF